MAKISLHEAVMDLLAMISEELCRDNSKMRYSYDDVMRVIEKCTFRLSLSYLDRVDDVATKEMSLEIDSLNRTLDSIRDENRRLRDKEEPCK
jgi:hypothetical protein